MRRKYLSAILLPSVTLAHPASDPTYRAPKQKPNSRTAHLGPLIADAVEDRPSQSSFRRWSLPQLYR